MTRRRGENLDYPSPEEIDTKRAEALLQRQRNEEVEIEKVEFVSVVKEDDDMKDVSGVHYHRSQRRKAVELAKWIGGQATDTG